MNTSNANVEKGRKNIFTQKKKKKIFKIKKKNPHSRNTSLIPFSRAVRNVIMA